MAMSSHLSSEFRHLTPVAVKVPFILLNFQGKVKQIVGSTLRDSSNDGMELVTNFESDKSPAEFTKLYKEDELLGGHVIMLGADPASQAAALEANQIMQEL